MRKSRRHPGIAVEDIFFAFDVLCEVYRIEGRHAWTRRVDERNEAGGYKITLRRLNQDWYAAGRWRFGFWTISAYYGQWTKAHAFPAEIEQVNQRGSGIKTACGLFPHGEFDSKVVPTIPKLDDVCRRCLRAINHTGGPDIEGVTTKLEKIKLARLLAALRAGKTVKVYLAALSAPTAEDSVYGERRVAKLRVNAGQLQCKLPPGDVEGSRYWWNVSIADLWIEGD